MTQPATAAPEGPSSWWRQASERFRAAPISHVLIAACVILYALGEFWGQGSPAQNWLMGANNGRAVREGEWYRLGAATFLHGSLMHLFMNMMGVWALSGLERSLGSGRFFLVYAASGFAGSIASAAFDPSTISVGASGAVWGLLGAAFGMRIPMRHNLRERGISLTHGWSILALNVAISFLPGVDATAHFGGGAMGFLLGATRFFYKPSARWVFSSAAAALAVLLASSVAFALASGQPWQLRGLPQLEPVAIGASGVRVGMPELIVDAGERLDADGHDAWRYGAYERSPIVVTVIVYDDPPAEVGDRGEAPFDDLLADARDNPLEIDWLERESVREQSIGGRRTVHEQYRGKTLRLSRYQSFVGSERVELIVAKVMGTRRELWEGVEEQIAASVRRAAR